MRGITHGVSAGVAYLAAGTFIWHQPVPILATGTAVCIGAGVLDDLDQRGSCVARSFGAVTEGLASVVHRISGGHREGTHMAVGNLICAGIAALAIALEGWHPLHLDVHGYIWRPSVGRWLLGAYLALLFAAGMKALRHPRRDLRREVIAVAAASAMVFFNWDTGGIAWAILLGTAVHCAGDSLTEHGDPWLAPFIKHRFHLVPKPLQFTTGTWPETKLIMPALVLASCLLAVHAVAPAIELSAYTHLIHAI
jgi:hypothetical protein